MSDPTRSAPVTLEDIRAALAQTHIVDVPLIGEIELRSVNKETALRFVSRLEKIGGAADLMAIGVEMLRATMVLDDVTDDDASGILVAAGGFRSELFRAAAGRCGCGELVDMMLEAISSTGAAAAGNLQSPASGAPATDGLGRTYTS